MTRLNKRQFATIVGTIVGMALVGATLGYGQGDAGSTDAPSEKAATEKPRAQARGRLPAYYARVVDSQQRERIYAIQRSYAEQMEPLRRQLAELEEQMRAEVRDVLSDEQQTKVDGLVAEARARREAAKAKRDAAGARASKSAGSSSAAKE